MVRRGFIRGGESLIPALDILIEAAAEKGVQEFVMGMAHRGRLSTLVNIFGKSAKTVFSEFEGKDYEEQIFDGDVKYHLGWTSKRTTSNNKKINLNIAPNPSHLEAVGSIVQGISRSKLDKYFNNDSGKVLPIIVHGDAAIAGQGLVYELVQMAKLDGYETGGTIHIVINNQIGFTTNYLDGRSSTYCTDVGKVTLSPVLHVNADDVEAVVHAVLFALDFRLEFKRDVFIDLLGYRKYGHNEGDEPRFTQPKLYKLISKHPNPKNIYSDKLINQSLISEEEIINIENEYRKRLENELQDSKKTVKTRISDFMKDEWSDYERVNNLQMHWGEVMIEPVDTTYPRNKLDKIVEVISTLPSEKKFISKIKKLVNNRQLVYENDKLDWSMAEHLAYAVYWRRAMMLNFWPRCRRGTFSSSCNN